jgi:hypothetical protein
MMSPTQAKSLRDAAGGPETAAGPKREDPWVARLARYGAIGAPQRGVTAVE